MACLLGMALGTTASFWLNLEMIYQLKAFDRDNLPPVERLAQ